MKKVTLLLMSLSLYLLGHSQIQIKKIDSIVRMIDAQKNLKADIICDTFKVDFSDLSKIECAKFFSIKGKLVKVIYSWEFHHKDTVRKNIPTQSDVFYYNDGLLIKVISKDFDQSPPKDFQFYLNERHLKKYLSKETINAGKYDGVNYFVEFGYNFLEEFKSLKAKK